MLSAFVRGRIARKLGVFVLVTAISPLSFSVSSSASEADELAASRSYVGPRAGLWYGTATLGMEYRRGRTGILAGYSLLVGFAAGVNYYSDPGGDSWVAGAYGFYLDEDEKDVTSIGLCGGYRWRFDSMWELTLGLGAGYAEKFEGGSTDEMFLIGPTLTIGYSFKVKV